MTDRIAEHHDAQGTSARTPADTPHDATTDGEAAAARPGDPAERELAVVAEAMAEVRAGVPTPGAAPAVPDDDEVAGLERAHETLRSTLDRVDRRG